jgi:hypothetical protein
MDILELADVRFACISTAAAIAKTLIPTRIERFTIFESAHDLPVVIG